MQNNKQKSLFVILLTLLATGLFFFIIGSFFRNVILPLELISAVCIVAYLLASSSKIKMSAQIESPHTLDPPLLVQASKEIRDESLNVDLTVLGTNYRRQETKNIENEVDSILDESLKLMQSKIDANTIAILFPTHDDGYCIRRYVSKSEHINNEAVIYPGVGVIGGFLKEGLKQLQLHEIVTDSMTLYYYKKDAGIRSLMASPIVVAGTERGFIIADSTEKKHFTDEAHAYLSAMAEVCGKAVYYAYMYNEHRLQYRHLVAMSSTEKFFFQKHDIDSVLDKMSELVPFAFRCDRMTISLRNRGENTAVVRRTWGVDSEGFLDMKFTMNDRSLASIIYAKNICMSRNYSKERYEIRYSEDEPQNRDLESFLAFPIGVDECKGMIFLESVQPNAFSGTSIELLSRLATSAGISIEKIQVLKQTQTLATHDGLTGLNNHRQFQQLLKESITRSIRYKEPLALVIGDIDHFKKLNDTHGHRFGDAVLKTIASTLESSIREDIDIAARYGGEEFALILEKTDVKTAQETVERIRQHIENLRFQTPKSMTINVTMSFGIAIYGKHAKNQEALIQRADKALYCAKGNGRNRAELYYEINE